jgi:hypothetical protein
VKQNGVSRGKLLGLARVLVVKLEQFISPADFIHVPKKITYKRKCKRGTTLEETCVGAAEAEGLYALGHKCCGILYRDKVA